MTQEEIDRLKQCESVQCASKFLDVSFDQCHFRDIDFSQSITDVNDKLDYHSVRVLVLYLIAIECDDFDLCFAQFQREWEEIKEDELKRVQGHRDYMDKLLYDMAKSNFERATIGDIAIFVWPLSQTKDVQTIDNRLPQIRDDLVYLKCRVDEKREVQHNHFKWGERFEFFLDLEIIEVSGVDDSSVEFNGKVVHEGEGISVCLNDYQRWFEILDNP
ncbi:hypothetical protein [Sanyastnella coralliicola]|uniref:hypothetical protein n=1 Tax=Sanyastnella coralliicola TaxID=3069118 RepID=UPI0027BA9CB9|nr:hypothetical protein [Longitalea sp. SCSIO 12813]